MAKAALENAVWDLEAQKKALPLSELLGGTRNVIPCGVSIGIQPSLAQLMDKIEAKLDGGLSAHQAEVQAGLGHARSSSRCASAGRTSC